jgi:threonylcarbamoyladenosine tRNA methylthiotransferase MtaB
MRNHARDANQSNTIIFNTCAVTGEAVRQARQSIRRHRKEFPQAQIVVTGCAAQIDADSFASMEEVDLVLGNTEKLQAQSYRQDLRPTHNNKAQVSDIMSQTNTAAHMIEGLEGRARAFVQVQNGCDHRCTFCIIPFGRGNSRSVPCDEVVRQTTQLVDNGYKEVVLTGVDLTSYGPDLAERPTLGQLVEQILHHVPSLERLRLSSIDSIEIDDHLFDLMVREPRLMPHLHLSLQSGSDIILKRMKRRHSRAQAIDFCQRILAARPEITLGADLITGFPTETEEMFQDTLNLVDQCDLTFLHVFPYSARPGTPAARMPQVKGNTVKHRAGLLRQKGQEALSRHLARTIGTEQEVLIEKPHQGHTQDFTAVTFDDPQPPGEILAVTITGHTDKALTAIAKAEHE